MIYLMYNTAIILLVIIIIYLVLRMRKKIKSTSKSVKTDVKKGFIKEWQERKANDSEYKAEIKELARIEAMKEAEAELFEKYKKEEKAKIVGGTFSGLTSKLSNGVKSLGGSEMFSSDKLDRMLGKKESEQREDPFKKVNVEKFVGTNSFSTEKVLNANKDMKFGTGGMSKLLGKSTDEEPEEDTRALRLKRMLRR